MNFVFVFTYRKYVISNDWTSGVDKYYIDETCSVDFNVQNEKKADRNQFTN